MHFGTYKLWISDVDSAVYAIQKLIYYPSENMLSYAAAAPLLENATIIFWLNKQR